MSIQSVDNLIAQDMQNQQAPVQAIPNVAAPVESAPVQQASVAEVQANVPRETSEPITNSAQEESVPNLAQQPAEATAPAAGDKTSPIDEYGNPVEKPKTYTEEEVQRMMRDRLARARQPEQAQQPAQPQAQPAQQPAEGDWEAQLEGFIEKTVDKREKERKERQETQWRAQEAARQADFEARFSTGMNKYQDFNQVVAGKPITDAMLRGTMSLDNPAAFVYGASKLHPQELSRISQISDPVMQAAEIGRLHERMVKTRNGTTAAPRPLEPARGDVTPRPANDRPNIDQLILQHAKQRQAQRR
jgi:hypothetical protein